ncbi:TPA: hypothetical protein ACPJ0O_002406 [Vibrio alginolyticus]
MKISRLKVFVCFLIFASLSVLSINDVMATLDAYRTPGDKVVMSGAINDASSFAFAWSVFVVSVFMVICLITGKKLLWIPKIVLVLLGLMAVVAFLLGWRINTGLIKELHQKKYIECTSERKLTLKYSSRTYVLLPEMCD